MKEEGEQRMAKKGIALNEEVLGRRR